MLDSDLQNGIPHGADIGVGGPKVTDPEIPRLIKPGRMLQYPQIRMPQMIADVFDGAVLRVAVHYHNFLRQVGPRFQALEMIGQEAHRIASRDENTEWQHI